MNETTMTVIGNLVHDPELRFTPAGQPVARFRIASTPRYRDNATGEWKDGEPLFRGASSPGEKSNGYGSDLRLGGNSPRNVDHFRYVLPGLFRVTEVA